MKAAWYEPVQSKMAPDNQPPKAMPSRVAINTVPTRDPAWAAPKYSRTINA